MPLQSPAQIEAMFRMTGGEAASFDGATTYGHLDTVDLVTLEEDGYQGGVVGKQLIFRFATGKLPGLRIDSEISVGGSAYRVVKPPQREQDGGLTVAFLSDPY